MNSKLEIITVTCKRDFYLLEDHFKSKLKYIDSNVSHTIILNDEEEHFSELVQVCNTIPDPFRRIIHRSELPGFQEDYNRYLEKKIEIPGWFLAQILNYYFSGMCNAEYYMIVTSRLRFTTLWPTTDIIQSEKSPVRLEPSHVLKYEKQFDDWFKSTYKYFKLTPNRDIALLRSNPPYIWKTEYAAAILKYIKEQGENLLDHMGTATSTFCDIYLYSAWLDYKNLRHTVYVTDFTEKITEVR